MDAEHTHRISQRWADVIVRWPTVVLAVTVFAALGCAALALFQLDIKASRNELIADDLEFNQRFLAWWNNFPGTYDLVVVADTQAHDGSDNSQATRDVIDALAQRLEHEPTVVQVDYGASASAFSPSTARLLPMDEFRNLLAGAADAEPLLESDTMSQLLGRSVSALREQDDATGEDVDYTRGIDQLTRLVRAIDEAMQGKDAAQALQPLASSPHATGSEGWQYLTSPNERFHFMRVTPRIEEDNINALGDAIAAVRAHVHAVDTEFPGVDAGLTGVEVIEADETDAATRDATLASIIALVAISILLIVSFRGVRTPVLLVVTLAVGIAWSFGYLLLAVGHLQILSVIFVLVLLGLGIDFGIHFISALESARHNTSGRRDGFTSALARAGRRSFPSITLGAVTTALAFGTTALTDFRGVAELGIIAAGGIVLCLLATFTVLPALVALFHHNVGTRAPIEDASDTRSAEVGDPPRQDAGHAAHHALRTIHTRPTLTLSVAGAFLVICAWYAAHIQFDYDLMRLQPEGVESVEWQNRLLEEGGVSAWFAVSITDDLEHARVRSAQFAELPTVGEVTGIALLFPPNEDEKLHRIEQTRRALQPALDAAAQEPTVPFSAADEAHALASQLTSLRAIFRPQLAREDLPDDVRRSMAELGDSLDEAIGTISKLNPTTRNARLSDLHAAYESVQESTAAQLTQLLSTDPLTPADFPDEMLRPYIDTADPGNPRYAIEIHPDPPPEVTNALDPAFLPRFVDDLKSIDPGVTGVLMQIYYTGSLMVRAYLFAGALAIVLVIILLSVAMRSLYDALLCIVPVALGFGAVLAAMDLTAHSLNAANIIVLPLMFGIGVDSGVHVIHRFRQHPATRPLGLSHGTGKGITVTCLTTVIGFGAMLLARHRGIQSLGLVMALGITLTLLACLIVLPAWLELRARGRGDRR